MNKEEIKRIIEQAIALDTLEKYRDIANISKQTDKVDKKELFIKQR